jgi:putative phage-type endonuclease
MKIINCEQGTEEWLNHRLGVATASNFNKIITSKGDLSKTIKTYALQLASELLTIRQEEGFKSDDMIRGNQLEEEARAAYEEYNFVKVDQVGFVSCDDYGYSPDGFVGKDGAVEFKCPKSHTHVKYLADNKLPTEYKAQVQGGLFCTGRQWCDFVSYHPDFIEDKRLLVVRVNRDEEFISKLKIGINKVIEMRNEIIKKIKG